MSEREPGWYFVRWTSTGATDIANDNGREWMIFGTPVRLSRDYDGFTVVERIYPPGEADKATVERVALAEIARLGECVVIPGEHDSNVALAFDRGAQKAFQKAAEIARAALAAVPVPVPNTDVIRFAHSILHGGAAHQQWLLDAATEFMAGRPVPPPSIRSDPGPSLWHPIARWRHLKRGTSYNILTSTAEAQCATGPINEGDHTTVYQGDGGDWHVRKTDEFQDGRFERVELTGPAPGPSFEDAAGVTCSPDVLNGKPVIAGTRIPTSDVRVFAEAGYTVAQITAEYPALTMIGIATALAYELSAHKPGRAGE